MLLHTFVLQFLIDLLFYRVLFLLSYCITITMLAKSSFLEKLDVQILAIQTQGNMASPLDVVVANSLFGKFMTMITTTNHEI